MRANSFWSEKTYFPIYTERRHCSSPDHKQHDYFSIFSQEKCPYRSAWNGNPINPQNKITNKNNLTQPKWADVAMVLCKLARPIDPMHSYYTSPCVLEIGLNLTVIEEICNIFYTWSIQHCIITPTEMKFGLAWVNHCQPNIRSFLNKKKIHPRHQYQKRAKKKNLRNPRLTMKQMTSLEISKSKES